MPKHIQEQKPHMILQDTLLSVHSQTHEPKTLAKPCQGDSPSVSMAATGLESHP